MVVPFTLTSIRLQSPVLPPCLRRSWAPRKHRYRGNSRAEQQSRTTAERKRRSLQQDDKDVMWWNLRGFTSAYGAEPRRGSPNVAVRGLVQLAGLSSPGRTPPPASRLKPPQAEEERFTSAYGASARRGSPNVAVRGLVQLAGLVHSRSNSRGPPTLLRRKVERAL